MHTRSFFFTLVSALLLGACGPAATEQDHAEQASEQEVAGEVHDHGSEAQAVQLDNGNTWAANTETTEGIAAMQALLAGFDPATGDAPVLHEELEAEFKEIFAKCTMTGEAHNQLHNYLIPVHKMLDGMGNEPSEAQRDELANYLATYGNYFH
ncbi:MAG TPA: hypothetical protein PLV70_04295 [Flavobacteriales bacterium]|nr:hypothetical protein [Flavobacteriales bacterium]HRN38317.1 hypothetical protein [Flavobacteriales bacterium]HRO40529.1 hypothetical protein [Flavobacteriales bacterium]HRP80754.1 hypothetical protein [Flavobacteriales bacterium]HRQ84312.1 hypothetical protein [Flavobacteriales bacterium]